MIILKSISATSLLFSLIETNQVSWIWFEWWSLDMIFKHVIIFDCGFLKWVGLTYQYGLVIQKNFEVSKNQIHLIF